MANEGMVNRPGKSKTTKRESDYNVDNWRKESPAWEEGQEYEGLWLKAEGATYRDADLR